MFADILRRSAISLSLNPRASKSTIADSRNEISRFILLLVKGLSSIFVTAKIIKRFRNVDYHCTQGRKRLEGRKIRDYGFR